MVCIMDKGYVCLLSADATFVRWRVSTLDKDRQLFYGEEEGHVRQ